MTKGELERLIGEVIAARLVPGDIKQLADGLDDGGIMFLHHYSEPGRTLRKWMLREAFIPVGVRRDVWAPPAGDGWSMFGVGEMGIWRYLLSQLLRAGHLTESDAVSLETARIEPDATPTVAVGYGRAGQWIYREGME